AYAKVYCVGPPCRSEKAKTRRPLAEFWMVEPEVAYMELPGLLELAEDFVCALVGRVLDRCAVELKTLERDVTKLEQIQKPFRRLTYDAASAFLARPEVATRAMAQGAPPFVPGN